MTRAAIADVPANAHTKAVRALDEFDELVTAYVAILDTQRAHVETGHFDALTQALARGDVIAERAATCGRRVSPLRDVLESGRYNGPRARDLAERFELARARAQCLGALAESASATCAIARDAAERAMKHATPRTSAAKSGYQTDASRPLAFDRHV